MFYTRMNEAAMGEYFDEAEIQESIYNDFEEGALVAMAENESNYNKLIESIGMMESAMFDEEGTVVYTEGMISSVWESLKKFVIKVWQKIVALFKRFVAMFDQFFMKDKEFVKKYRVRVMKSDVKDLEFNGYPFPNVKDKGDKAMKAIDAHFGQISATDGAFENVDAEGSANKVGNGYVTSKDRGDQLEDKLDTFRGSIIKGSGKVDKDDFSDELKEYFYGSDSPESLDEKDMDLGTQLRIIESTKDMTKEVNNWKKNIDRAFKATIKKIDDKKGEVGKQKGAEAYKTSWESIKDPANSGNQKYANGDAFEKNGEPSEKDAANKDRDNANSEFSKTNSFVVSLIHDESAIVTQVTGMALNALKDRNRQARAICVKAIAKSGKFTEESAGFEYPEYGTSFLSDIEFK